MIRRALSFFVLLQFVAGSVAQRSPMHEGPAGAFTSAALVNEGDAKGTLEKDDIRVALPLSAPARPGIKVVLWLESPKGVRSGETVAGMSADGRFASAVLSWPKNAKGKPEGDIGWYRVGYRVEGNDASAASGVLAVGAIATNLMELRLAYPKLVMQGRIISARVIAVNPVTSKLLAGVRLKATLAGDEDSKKSSAQTRTSVTGRNGEAIMSFSSSGGPGDTLDLTVEGSRCSDLSFA